MTVHTPTEPETVAAALARAAGRHFGVAAAVEGLRRESGGASRQTWSFDVVAGGKRHELILRRDPPSLRETSGPDRPATSLDRATEFRVLAAAHKAGVRAPEVLFELTSGDGLGDGFVMRRVGGRCRSIHARTGAIAGWARSPSSRRQTRGINAKYRGLLSRTIRRVKTPTMRVLRWAPIAA